MTKLFLVFALLLLAAPAVVYADMPGFSSTGIEGGCKLEPGKIDPCAASGAKCVSGTCK